MTRAELIEVFPWLEADEAVSGADVIDALTALYAGLPGGGPLADDNAIAAAARATGYSVVTRRPVVNVDAKLLPASLFRKTPDYGKIRTLLMNGHAVAGAELTTDVVYVLARPDAPAEQDV